MSEHPPALLWWLPEYPPDPGGIATFAGHLVPALGARGHRVTGLIVRGGPERSEPAPGVTLRREPYRETLEAGDPLRTLRLQSTTRQVKADADADVYHVHLCEPSPFLHLATRDTAPGPTVLTMHNEFIAGFDPDDAEGLTTRLFDASSVVTCVSTTATRAFARVAQRYSHRLVPIPNGAPVPDSVIAAPDAPRLVAVGRLAAQKGFERLLRAMPAVVAVVPDAHLDLLGDGPERDSLTALVDELDLHAHVTMHGHVERDVVAEVLDRSRIVVAPSRHEGLPYVALEAAGHARAIVATGVAGIDEVVVDGETGLLLDSDTLDDDVTPLVDAIVTLLSDPERCDAMGLAGRARVERIFSLDACLDRYQQVYDATLAAPTTVAVILPARNGERFLADAIESALAAIEFADVDAQVIVIDDGSTDSTGEVAAAFADRGVEVFPQPNLGTGLARNTGLALTNSTWVAHLDADDRWPVDRLRVLLDAAADAERRGVPADAVFGHAVEFAEADAPDTARVDTEPALVRMGTAGLIRRAAFDRIGGHADAGSNDQVEWVARALDAGMGYVAVDELVLERRIHASNKSHTRPFTSDLSRVALVKAHLDRVRRGDAPPTP